MVDKVASRRKKSSTSRYVGWIRFVFHNLKILPIRFTQKKTCIASTTTNEPFKIEHIGLVYCVRC